MQALAGALWGALPKGPVVPRPDLAAEAERRQAQREAALAAGAAATGTETGRVPDGYRDREMPGPARAPAPFGAGL